MDNRVSELYDLAVKFFALPEMAGYVIGTHFNCSSELLLHMDVEETALLLFRRIIERDEFEEFKRLVNNYQTYGYGTETQH
jgi:hypothetical protein